MCTKISFILSNKPYTVGARSWVPN